MCVFGTHYCYAMIAMLAVRQAQKDSHCWECKQYYSLRFLEFIVYFYYEYQQRRWLNDDFFSTATTDSNSFTPFIMVFRIILLLLWHFSDIYFYLLFFVVVAFSRFCFFHSFRFMSLTKCVMCGKSYSHGTWHTVRHRNMIMNHSEQYQLFRCIVHLIDIFLERFFLCFCFSKATAESDNNGWFHSEFRLHENWKPFKNRWCRTVQSTVCSVHYVQSIEMKSWIIIIFNWKAFSEIKKTNNNDCYYLLCRIFYNINFFITICNKSSINVGNALWWAEKGTYLDREIADMRLRNPCNETKKLKRKNLRRFWWIFRYFDFLGIERIQVKFWDHEAFYPHAFVSERMWAFLLIMMLHHASSCSILFGVWKNPSAGNSRLALDSG